ncbi:DUF2334 domain-containing protein [Candidatus Pacearchaeota archaeon]|nr:DUF2334 domain-containing protein [Candidatus Pacearchaeota archaeon]
MKKTMKKSKKRVKKEKHIRRNIKRKIPTRILQKYYSKKPDPLKFLRIFIFLFLEILVIILIIFFTVYLFRTISNKHIDDVNPLIQCDKELLAKADVYYIIPKFKNIKISNYPDWCNYIKSQNKILKMHGITHEYLEFKTDKSEEYIKEGIEIFEKCFGIKPIGFRPPQLEISKQNKILIKKFNMTLDLYASTNLHKVYHCNNTGIRTNFNIEVL